MRHKVSYRNILKRNGILCRLFNAYKIWSKIIPVLALNCIFSAQVASTLYKQELIQQFGIWQQDLVNLEQGKVVSFQITENDEKELAAGGN